MILNDYFETYVVICFVINSQHLFSQQPPDFPIGPPNPDARPPFGVSIHESLKF